MSSRALRKLQKEKDLNVLIEDESITESHIKRRVNVFDLLENDDILVEDEDSNEEEEVIVKAPIVSKKKKKKKSKKSKAKLDEVDLAIEAVNREFGMLPLQSENDTAIEEISKSVFALDLKSMDWELEMIRNFGPEAVTSSSSKDRRRGKLVTPKSAWPRSGVTGLTMISGDEFILSHSPAYEECEFTFYQSIATHNPNTLYDILRENPFHILSLLQLSESFKHDGDVLMAHDFTERAIYAFEGSLHPSFNLSSGACRLNFDSIESRPIFVALYRNVQYLARKGCWKTALEFLKLLYSLSPTTDPFCCVLMTGFYSIKAEAYKWYKEYWAEYEIEKGLFNIPSEAYFIALAEFELESKAKKNHNRSTELLTLAIQRFPTAISKIFSKLSLSDFSNDVYFSTPKFLNGIEKETLLVLIDLYVESSHTLWKVPVLLQWLRATAKTVLQGGADESLDTDCKFGAGFPLNLCRLIVLSDENTFISSLPRGAMDGLMVFDPFPPLTTRKSAYDLIRGIPVGVDDGVPSVGAFRWLMNLFGREDVDVDLNPPELEQEADQ